jgi:hypothetical protein
MCTASVATHLCGARIRVIEIIPCSAYDEVNKLAESLDPSGIIRSGLREKEIIKLRKLCREESNERHLLRYYLKCEACVEELRRLIRDAIADEVPLASP